MINGKSVRVARGKIKFNSSRDWPIGEAQRILTAAYPQATVEYVREERAIKAKLTTTTAQVIAFKQDKEDSKGSFRNDFVHLALP